MSYSRNDRPVFKTRPGWPLRVQRRQRALAAALVLAVVLTIAALLWFPRLPDFLAVVSRPFWSGGSYLKRQWYRADVFWGTKGKLVVENRELKEELLAARSRLLSYDLLKSENESLRGLLGRPPAPPISSILARVISGLPKTPYDLIIVDVGRLDRAQEFKVGDLAVASGSILIGRVATIDDRTSRIQLFSTPGNQLDVVVGENLIPATALGRGGGNFVISLPRNIEVKEGDAVWLKELGPEQILAVVGGFESDHRRSLQKIFLRTPLNLNQLDYVVVYPQTN